MFNSRTRNFPIFLPRTGQPIRIPPRTILKVVNKVLANGIRKPSMPLNKLPTSLAQRGLNFK